MVKLILINLVVPTLYGAVYFGLRLNKFTIGFRLLCRDYIVILLFLQILIVMVSFFIWRNQMYRIAIIIWLLIFVFLMHKTIGEFNPY